MHDYYSYSSSSTRDALTMKIVDDVKLIELCRCEVWAGELHLSLVNVNEEDVAAAAVVGDEVELAIEHFSVWSSAMQPL